MQERRFLLITSFLIALIGAPAVYSVVKEPSREDLVQNSEKQEKVLATRAPASLPTKSKQDFEGTRRNAIKSKSVVMEFKCPKENPVLEVDGSLLRLKGNSCIDEKWKDVSIVNHTNGFTGSVIFLKDKNFTTDFIDLKEGENKLSILAKDEKGKAIEQTFIVQRRVPASVPSEQ